MPRRFMGTNGGQPVSRTINRLTALAVSRASFPGYYPDGAGLYLQVGSTGTKSWILRYTIAGRAREMGLGALTDFNLAAARERAQQCRQQRAMGVDPSEARRAAANREKLEGAKAITFKDAAEKYIGDHEASWRNEKHRAQWRSTLQNY